MTQFLIKTRLRNEMALAGNVENRRATDSMASTMVLDFGETGIQRNDTTSSPLSPSLPSSLRSTRCLTLPLILLLPSHLYTAFDQVDMYSQFVHGPSPIGVQDYGRDPGPAFDALNRASSASKTVHNGNASPSYMQSRNMYAGGGQSPTSDMYGEEHQYAEQGQGQAQAPPHRESDFRVPRAVSAHRAAWNLW